MLRLSLVPRSFLVAALGAGILVGGGCNRPAPSPVPVVGDG
jgi:hypothetical protein